MSTDNEELLDIFVGVRPSPNFLSDVDKLVDEATKRIISKFGSITVPSPRFGPPNVGGGGSGRGGGGGSGGPQYGPPRPPNVPPVNPPAPPGGRGGGGTAPGANPNQAFLDAIRSAEDLQRKTDRVFDTINQKTQPQLANQFELAKNELEDILVLLRRSSQDRDPLRLQEGLDRLRQVRSRFQGAQGESLIGQTGGSSQRAQLVEELRELERMNRQKDQIRSTLAQSALQGLPFAEKMDLRAVNSQIRTTQVELDGLIRGFNGTEQSLEQVIQKFLELNKVEDISTDLRDRLQQVYSRPLPDAFETLRNTRAELEMGLKATGRSFNTLSNNAYQFGQAIEDFSVGYSLNGFAGGIRGAANNVAFLLNDMSRLESVQAKLGPQWAKQLPLIAGIGSALAITVLPPLIEWLASLDDIESKFDDISKKIDSEFSDVKFAVGLSSDERSFLRTIQYSSDLKAALESLRDVVDETSDENFDLQEIFQGLSGSENIAKASEDMKAYVKLIQQYREELNRDAERAEEVRQTVPYFLQGFLPEKSALDDIAEASRAPSRELSVVQDKVRLLIETTKQQLQLGSEGVFDSEKLKNAVSLFSDVSDSFEKIKKDGDLSDPAAIDRFAATLNSLRDAIKFFSESSDRIDSANRKIASGLDLARRKAEEFAQEQLLITKVIEGSANEEQLFGFDVTRTVNALAAGIEKVRVKALAASKQTGTNPDLINENADALREGLRIETINNILLRQKDIRKQIADAQDEINKRDGESQLTTLDKISQDLIKAQFSVRDESIDENTRNLANLNEQMAILNETIRNINKGFIGAISSERDALMSLPIGAGPSAMNLANMLDFAASAVVMRDAVAAGVRDAMAGQQKQVVDELKGVNDGVRKINNGAQP